VIMLAIYSVGWEVDAPLFFALPPLPRVYGDLQISFVAAKGGEILIICVGSGRLQRRYFHVFTVYFLTRILQRMYCIRAMFIFECVID
jgi:hypothetical protein